MIRFPTKRSFLSLLNKSLTKEYPSIQFASVIPGYLFSKTNNSSPTSFKLTASFLVNLKSNFFSSSQSQNSKGLAFSPMAKFSSSAEGKFYVSLKNLSYSQKTKEIHELLTDLGVKIDPQDIILNTRFDGKYSGDAFVLCHSQEDLNTVLTLNNQRVASRYIKASPAVKSEFEKAKIAIQPLSQEVTTSQENGPITFHRWSHILEDQFGVIKLKDVPQGSKKEDIMAYFQGFKIVEDGIQIRKEGNTCFVVFESRAEAQQAKREAEAKEVLKHITFKESNIPILEHFLKENDAEVKGKRKRKKKVPEEKKVRILVMRNVPLTVAKEDILKFFEGFKLAEKDVTLRTSRAGVFTGRAEIMFKSQEDVHKAFIAKNLSRFGDQYIEMSDYWG